MFEEVDAQHNHTLDEEQVKALNDKLIASFPRFGQDCGPGQS